MIEITLLHFWNGVNIGRRGEKKTSGIKTYKLRISLFNTCIVYTDISRESLLTIIGVIKEYREHFLIIYSNEGICSKYKLRILL